MGAAWVYPQLPPEIPTHWNLRGEVDGYSSRALVFLIGPGVMLLQIASFALLPRLAPRRFEVEPFLATWLDLMLIVVGITGCIFGVLMFGSLNPEFASARAMFACVAMLFLLVGNLMGRVRRNFFLGVRTPWTLVSETVWNATHRFAARCMVAAGIAGVVLVTLPVPLWSVTLVLALAIAVPVVYSYVRYRSESQREKN